jgi:glutamyl-tRNA reductase
MPGGIDLLVMGLSHRTAPVALRERLAVVPELVGETVQALAALPTVREAALLSTCNRVEVYASSPDPDQALVALRRNLAARAGATDEELAPHLYVRVDVEAVHHLFRVAASLDSLVVGEPQILGQVKVTYDTALALRTAGPVLGACFAGAFRIARRVRRETEIARNPVSISSVAIEYARKIFEGFQGRTVLIVGAGKMADLAARALRGQGAELLVTNRTPGRAEELAARIGGRVHPFDDLGGALMRADIVIASTGARQPILTSALVARAQRRRRGRLLFLIDIAVPRDVEAGCAEIPDVFVADIDDLQKLAASHRDGRRGEAERAEAMVEQEVARFLEAYRGRRVGPVITALRARVLGLAQGEATRVLAANPGVAERERRMLSDLADAVAKKLLHGAQVALKKGGADPVEGAALLAAVQRLFDLEVADVDAHAHAHAHADAEAADAEAGAGAVSASPGKVAGR